MIVNVWMEIRDTFAYPAADPADDTQLQAKNRETLALAADIAVVPLLFKKRIQGPRSFDLYSLLYVDVTQQSLEQKVERFASENPGDTAVMGAWYWEYGNEFGTEPTFTEVPNPGYNGDTESPTIPNPNYQPDPDLPDYDPRETLRNPVYDGALTLTEIGQTGVPLYPIPGALSAHMPNNGDGTPNTTLRDVNLYMGQAPRLF